MAFTIVRSVSFVFICAAASFAQQLPFRHYTSDHGLVQNQVFDIYQDRFGFMWFASTGGISRYDGVSFQNFTLKDGLPSLGVKCIVNDRNGNLWFGTNNGLAKFDYDKFTPYTVDSGFVTGTVWSALCDRNGTLWFGTREGGLVRYDGTRFQSFSTAQGLENDGIYGLYEARDGLLWIGTRSHGVYTYDGNSFANIRFNPGGKESIIRSFQEDSSGDLWIFSYGGGIRVRRNHQWIHISTQDGLPENDVYRNCASRSGRIFISTVNKGFLWWDGKKFSSPVKAEHGLIGNQVLCIYEDAEGNLWFGCANGISKLSTFRYQSWTERHGLPSSRIYSIKEDVSKNLWVGTDAGIAIFTTTGIRRLDSRNGLPDGQVWSFIPNDDGSMWIGTVKGLYFYDTQSLRRIDTGSPISDQNISQMLRDRSGNLWIGSTIGVTRFDGRSFRDYGVADGLSNLYCYSIAQDCTGVMWFGTNHGLNRLEGDRFNVYYAGNGLRDDDINTMLTDRNGTLWIGTNSGLHSYRNGVFRFFGDSSGISDAVLVITADSSGMLWLASKYSTFAFDGERVVDRLSKTSGTIGTEVITANSMYTDHRNRLWIGFFEGLTQYDRSVAEDRSIPPPTRVTGWKIGNDYETIPYWKKTDEPRLEYNRNTVTFYFRGLSFNEEREVTYQYFLDGLDDGWSRPDRSAEVRYTNLNPGLYQFKVRAINRHGVVGTEEAVFRFQIRAPFWRQWWFMTLLVTLGIAVGWQGVRYRTRRILRRNRELEVLIADRTKALREYSLKLETYNQQILTTSEHKSKFLSNMSHELRTPLNAIIGFSNILLDASHSPLNPEQKRSVTAMQISARNLLNLVNDLLDLSKIEAGRMELVMESTDVAYLVNSVKEGLLPLFLAKKQDIRLQIERDIPEIRTDREKIKQVLVNLLSNANKFTPDHGKITIDVRKTTKEGEPAVEISVSDTGKGIPPAELETIFDEFRQSSMNRNRDGTGLGLTLCRRLIDLHRGTIFARSDGKNGSTFVVLLPLH